MDHNGKAKQIPVIKRKLTPQEQKAIDCLQQKKNVNAKSIFCMREEEGNENLELAIDESLESHEASDLMDFHIMEVTGAANKLVGLQLIKNVAKATVSSNIQGKELVQQLNIAAKFMQALAPQDEYEGQLVVQLVVLHEQAMTWLGRAMRTERPDFANIYLNGASKLLTRHHETLEALLKYRRKGEQRVHVEHVHIPWRSSSNCWQCQYWEWDESKN